MTISRREFLAKAVGAATFAVGQGGLRDARARVQTEDAAECVLLDAGGNCALRESLRGYRSALAEAGARCRLASPQQLPAARYLILPGIVTLEPPIAAALRQRVEQGGVLVLESGAAFADPVEFRTHQSWLKDSFGVLVEAPVELWSEKADCRRVPYVDYSWPRPTKVRDFSRVIPVSGRGAEVMAWADGHPVALRRRMGHGTFVFLGSPLGPGLGAGDREARRWLLDLLASV